MPKSVKDVGDRDVVEAVEQIQSEPDDEKTRQLEKGLLEQTDNGWQEGDPVEQPEQDPPLKDGDEGAPAG